MLKSNCTQHSSKVVSINTPAESHFHSGMINSKEKCQVYMWLCVCEVMSIKLVTTVLRIIMLNFSYIC